MNVRRERLALAWVTALLIGAGPPGFRGCGGDDATRVDVPLGPDARTCETESDCLADRCGDFRCVAGACVHVGSARDADFDGHAAAPCGDDCNDANAAVFRGAREQCNGIDDDCDGVIDNGAADAEQAFEAAGADTLTRVVRFGDAFAMTRISDGLLIRTIGNDGALGPYQELLRGGTFEALATAVTTGGRLLLVVVAAGGGTTSYIVVEPAGRMARVLAGPSTIPSSAEGSVRAVSATAIGDTFVVRVVSGTGGTRRDSLVLLDADGMLTERVELTNAAPGDDAADASGVASDGTHIVAAVNGGRTLRWLTLDGGVTGERELTGRARGLHALASGDGFVLALVEGASGTAAATVTQTRSVPLAPALQPADLTNIFATERGFVLVGSEETRVLDAGAGVVRDRTAFTPTSGLAIVAGSERVTLIGTPARGTLVGKLIASCD